MARKIVLTSGKGGVGKTTTCANLGATLASKGLRVALLDIDIGLNNLDVVMGVENKVVYDIVDVISGKCRAKQALIQDYKYPSLYVMPSAHTYLKDSITGEHIKSVVDNLAETFDYVLIDCPAGIDLGFHRAITAASEAIVITTPHISAIRDADKVFTILRSYNLISTSLVINRVRGDLILEKEMLSVEDITKLLKEKLVGAIPEDDEISTMILEGGTISRVSECRMAFDMLANNIHFGSDIIYDCTAKYKGFMGGLRRSLKRKI